MTTNDEISFLNQFIHDKCEISADSRIEKRIFYEKFAAWAKPQAEGNFPISMNSLGQLMQLKGFRENRTKIARCWAGIRLSVEKEELTSCLSSFLEEETAEAENPELVAAKAEKPEIAPYSPFEINKALETLLLRRMSGVEENS